MVEGASRWSRSRSPEHEEAWLEHAETRSCRDLALGVSSREPGEPAAQARRPQGPPGDPVPARRQGRDADVPEARPREEEALGRVRPARERRGAARRAGRPASSRSTRTARPGADRVYSSLYRIVLRPDGDGLAADDRAGPAPVEGAEAIRCDAEVVRAEGSAREGAGTRATHEDPNDLDPKTPPWLRRRVLARDGHRCRSCGLAEPDGPPHPLPLAGRSHERQNLVTLCARCHGLVHDGLLVLVGRRRRPALPGSDGKAIDRPSSPCAT